MQKRSRKSALIVILCCKIYLALSYDCVFGFSTGHVGTGTFSDEKSYKNTSHIEFFFEGSRMSTSESCNIRKATYGTGFSALDEENFVSKKLAPFMNSAIQDSNKKILVDLGHANLFYYRGIARYFSKYVSRQNETFCSKIHFIRIRRERYESATSLMYINPKKRKGDNMCRTIIYGFCPYENTDSVLLVPPSRKKWDSLNAFQHALWLIDETEARWEAFQKDIKGTSITTSELYWCSNCEGDSSISHATALVARILKTAAVRSSNLPHQHVHAGQMQKNDSDELERKRNDDREYQQAMNYIHRITKR